VFAVGILVIVPGKATTQTSLAADRNAEDNSSDRNSSSARAKELALRAHARAAAIDRLPRFYIRAHAGTQTDMLLKNPSGSLLENLKRALDEPVVEKDWFRYLPTFAWDEEHFLIGSQVPDGADQATDDALAGIPRRGNYRWGTRKLSGEWRRLLNEPATHVLRGRAAAMWKDVHLSDPNYVLATRHEFWWGDNSHHNQHFAGSLVPPSRSRYRSLGTEEFDGETCNVVESPTRMERLWISQDTGLIRGYLSFTAPRRNAGFGKSKFHTSAAVQEITGRSFATLQEYTNWYLTEYEQLPVEKKWALSKAWTESIDWEKAQPTLIVRFRDFREIAPGIWWPFREDRAQGLRGDKAFEYMRSEYAVDQVRTDVDLSETVKALRPKEGERVQDQRYAIPVNYTYRAERSEAEILKMVDAEYQERMRGQEFLNRLKEPIKRWSVIRRRHCLKTAGSAARDRMFLVSPISFTSGRLGAAPARTTFRSCNSWLRRALLSSACTRLELRRRT